MGYYWPFYTQSESKLKGGIPCCKLGTRAPWERARSLHPIASLGQGSFCGCSRFFPMRSKPCRVITKVDFRIATSRPSGSRKKPQQLATANKTACYVEGIYQYGWLSKLWSLFASCSFWRLWIAAAWGLVMWLRIMLY